MKIILNGKTKETEEIILSELLKNSSFDSDKIVVEHNSKVVLPDNWPDIRLAENDIIEIISFVGGG